MYRLLLASLVLTDIHQFPLSSIMVVGSPVAPPVWFAVKEELLIVQVIEPSEFIVPYR